MNETQTYSDILTLIPIIMYPHTHTRTNRYTDICCHHFDLSLSLYIYVLSRHTSLDVPMCFIRCLKLHVHTQLCNGMVSPHMNRNVCTCIWQACSTYSGSYRVGVNAACTFSAIRFHINQ